MTDAADTARKTARDAAPDAATDARWMAHAVRLAIREKGPQPADTPIAAVLVREGRVIAEGVNRTDEACDATAHAEMMAFRAAGKVTGTPRAEGATLYSTLQPCGMCTMAALWMGVSRIVYGAGRGEVHESYFEDRSLDTLDFLRDAYKDDITLAGGVLRADCARLYYGPDDDVPAEQEANR